MSSYPSHETAKAVFVKSRLVIKTFEKDSRPKSRPWAQSLETKTKTLASRPGLEIKTLVIRSWDQSLLILLKYLLNLKLFHNKLLKFSTTSLVFGVIVRHISHRVGEHSIKPPYAIFRIHQP